MQAREPTFKVFQSLWISIKSIAIKKIYFMDFVIGLETTLALFSPRPKELLLSAVYSNTDWAGRLPESGPMSAEPAAEAAFCALSFTTTESLLGWSVVGNTQSWDCTQKHSSPAAFLLSMTKQQQQNWLFSCLLFHFFCLLFWGGLERSL